MPNQSRKRRGRETEHIVTARLQSIWEGAYVVNSGASGSDVLGVPFDCEIKARKDFKPKEALEQLAKRNKGQKGFVVMRLNGQGEASVDDFAAVIRFGDLLELLERYYNPNETDEIIHCGGCGMWTIKGRICSACGHNNGFNK